MVRDERSDAVREAAKEGSFHGPAGVTCARRTTRDDERGSQGGRSSGARGSTHGSAKRQHTRGRAGLSKRVPGGRAGPRRRGHSADRARTGRVATMVTLRGVRVKGNARVGPGRTSGQSGPRRRTSTRTKRSIRSTGNRSGEVSSSRAAPSARACTERANRSTSRLVVAASAHSPGDQVAQLSEHEPLRGRDALAQLGRGALRRQQQDGPGAGVVAHGAQEGGDAVDQQVLGVGSVVAGALGAGAGQRRHRPGQLGERAGLGAVEQGGQQGGDVGELPVDHRPGDLAGPRDAVHRHGVEAVGEHDRQRAVEQLLAPLRRGHAGRVPAARGGCAAHRRDATPVYIHRCSNGCRTASDGSGPA